MAVVQMSKLGIEVIFLIIKFVNPFFYYILAKFAVAKTVNQAGCHWLWDIPGQADKEWQQLSTEWWKKGGGLYGEGAENEGKVKGQRNYTCRYMLLDASQNKERGRGRKIRGDEDPSLISRKYKSTEAHRETQRQQRTTAYGDRTGRGGCSWHILQLLFLTAIRTCQSLSTCHSLRS